MKKWMISLLSVLALVLTFSGCGGSAGSSSSVAEEKTPAQATSNSELGIRGLDTVSTGEALPAIPVVPES